MQGTVDIAAVEAEIARLDRALAPLARRPVDITKPGWVENLRAVRPLEEAGVAADTQALLEGLLPAYALSAPAERAALRALFARYTAFRWAATLPAEPVTAERVRLRLLLLSVRDQGTDARDEILALRHLCRSAADAGVDVAPILREVAALSSDQDRFGMGSTRDLMLGMAERFAK